MSKPIDMTGVARWKVRNKNTWEMLARFYTYEEAKEFIDSNREVAQNNNVEMTIVWD